MIPWQIITCTIVVQLAKHPNNHHLRQMRAWLVCTYLQSEACLLKAQPLTFVEDSFLRQMASRSELGLSTLNILLWFVHRVLKDRGHIMLQLVLSQRGLIKDEEMEPCHLFSKW